MKKLKLYLDTSVFNFALSDRTGDENAKTATEKLLQKIKQDIYDGYISELVMREVIRAPELKRTALINLINDLNLESLVIVKEIEMLAEKYIEEGLIPKKYQEDAIHIAIASINDLDVIVSWNFEHMVKLKTRKGVIAVNELMGYKAIEIITPQEVD
ncbi:MAG: PIN domain-containing protein [Elusimicrobia bacterium]|nr:PIN domain-containing protein [Candidatus Liberimonas magnetica]